MPAPTSPAVPAVPGAAPRAPAAPTPAPAPAAAPSDPAAEAEVADRALAYRIVIVARDRTIRDHDFVPVAVGLAAAGGAVIASRALQPVREMSRAARQITAEDLGRRLSRRGADDEIDHLADTLNAMLEGLEATFAQSRRFSADAAHELRTPLTALKGEMEVALRAARSPEEYRRVLASSLEEVEHLIRLAEDLLVFSRSSPGLAAPSCARSGGYRHVAAPGRSLKRWPSAGRRRRSAVSW